MDAGASCNGHFKAASKDELMRRVLDHFRERHGVTKDTEPVRNLVEKLSR